MNKQWYELTDKQQAQVYAMFDQRLSEVPERYTYEIGTAGDVLSRRYAGVQS